MKYLKAAKAFLVAFAVMAALLFALPGIKLRDLPRRTRRAWGYHAPVEPMHWRKRLAMGLPLLPIAGGATIKGSRTPIFYKSVPGGPATLLDATRFTGNIFYVDSNAAGASDGEGYGSTPDSPLATIDYAIGLCTANQGDVIIVLPGHAESINAASAIDADKAGISIIGLGIGEDRPTITVGTSLDTAMVDIGAADVLIKNIIFQPGNDGVDVLVSIAADGATLEDCELRSDETNAYQADTYIQIAGGANVSDRATIRRCKISSITAGAAQAILITAAQDALVIEDCWIDGDFSAAGIYSTAIFTNAMIRRNAVSNRAAGIHAVEFTDAATGLFLDNRMYGDTLGTILDPGSLKCLGNLETDAIDQAGVDSPRTSAGGFPDNSITAASIAAAAIDAATFAADALQAMQDEAQDAIQGEQLDHLVAVTDGAGAALLTVVDGTIISKLVSKVSGGDTSSFDNTTDSLEMLSDKAGAFTGDGGAGQDDSVKASLDLAHTDLDAILADTGTDGVVLAANAMAASKMATDFAAWRLARSGWDFAVDTGGAAAYTVFTVTGNVLLQIFGICESTVTEGGAVSIELGVAGNTAVFIAQIADAGDLLENEIWIDATPTTTVEAVDLEGAKTFIVSNGQDVQFLIGVGGLTAGKINFYALWKPLSANGSVVAA